MVEDAAGLYDRLRGGRGLGELLGAEGQRSLVGLPELRHGMASERQQPSQVKAPTLSTPRSSSWCSC